MVFALPHRDALGRRIVMCRASAFNPSKHMNYDILRAIGCVIETLLEEEENQIRGLIYLIDLTGLGFNYLSVFTPSQVLRLFKNAEVSKKFQL
jgi:hypothetical protein